MTGAEGGSGSVRDRKCVRLEQEMYESRTVGRSLQERRRFIEDRP